MVVSALVGPAQSLEHPCGAQNSWYTPARFGERMGEAEGALVIITVLHQTHVRAGRQVMGCHSVATCSHKRLQTVPAGSGQVTHWPVGVSGQQGLPI